MRNRTYRLLIVILVLVALAATSLLVNDINIHLLGIRFERHGMRLGLDLRGGSHLVYKADKEAVTSAEMDVLVDRIQRRVNGLGVTEPIIQRMGKDRVLIQLPGIKDVQAAKELIGKTAFLEFREEEYDDKGATVLDEQGRPKWKPAIATGTDGAEKQLTGEYLVNTEVAFDPQTNFPEVAFTFNTEGAKLLEQISGRLFNTNASLRKPLGIFLDGQLISAPIVQAVLSSQGRITNMGQTRDEALQASQALSLVLRSGYLPVPISIIQERTVDATLGADSIRKSFIAGIVGTGTVLLFMIVYYRLPGFLAGVALLIYGTFMLSIFKTIPVTLTLSGIAAFILSLGMAVDANVLIFERMKEELRMGRTLGAAIEAGFARAWTSIRDSNISSIITSIILIWFGNQLGASLVTGFGVTLLIGVLVSMFSAITVTRTLMRLIAFTPLARKLVLFMPIGTSSLPSPSPMLRGRQA